VNLRAIFGIERFAIDLERIHPKAHKIGSRDTLC
jgi:hypothetical protein